MTPRCMAKSFLFWRAYHAHVEKYGEEPSNHDLTQSLGWTPGTVTHYSRKHPNLPLREAWRDSRSCVESIDSYIRRNADAPDIASRWYVDGF